MTAFKCKMCGGNLNIEDGVTVLECEYCGTKQTVPQVDDEKKLSLFNRANRLRFACEFDKAAGVYESIVADFPEEAEAYWGLVLCKYGIEYVDDPATSKKIPTCHRSSFDSVMDDSNFEQVLENADPIARSIYRNEAKQMEELRKSIVEVSSKEEPYDIFICYKETDEHGDRTIDSLIAQDVYDALTQKGYRVFFSRITLEDKLGQEYEPYIFAALNSAKIMLAFGTDYEYYNAVWVKNEWSRFLQLIAKGEKKTLIPCYKGIDAYDMPKEFARLQAQDMGKVGAIQDLLRGIEKLLQKNKTTVGKETVVVQQTPQQSATVSSLLKRAFMFLEDGDWKSAEEYCNKVLDIDPENAEAYLGLLMSESKVHRELELANLESDFSKSKSYVRILQFAAPERKAVIEKYRDTVITRFKTKRKEEERLAEKRKKEAERRREEEQHLAAEKRREERRRLTPIRQNIQRAKNYIFAGSDYTVCLKADGKVLATGDNGDSRTASIYWNSIVAVFCNSSRVFGLRANGTLATTDALHLDKFDVSKWTDIVDASCCDERFVGLQSDGKVLTITKNGNNQLDVSSWNDIVGIDCGDNHIIGLKSDGTVVAVGDNYYRQCNVSKWTDVVAVSTSNMHTIGLKADGTVVATGKNENGQCNVSDWTDIIAISCGTSHTVGLKSDGTVVSKGKCDVTTWNSVVAISCSDYHTIGLRSDGTIVSTGKNNSGQCNVTGWKLFDDYYRIDDEQKMILRKKGKCQHCGGEFKGIFSKTCTQCGKPKDY